MTSAEPDQARPAHDPAPQPLRLLVVDADRRVRSSLTDLLGLADHVEIVASAGHARAALDACEAERPDAVIVDPRLPELPDGIAFVRGLRAERPWVRVVVVAWSSSLALLVGDDPGIAVVAAEGGDLADRIVEALRAPVGAGGGSRADPDARLGATA